ncbi:MAG: hypothetical protein ABIO84_08290 [Lysobacter sp.]
MSIRTLLLSICVLGLAAACASSPAPTAVALASDELRFAGAIEAIDDGCLADGICSLMIDGRKVVWMIGWSREAWGSVSAERRLGGRVEVWCRTTATGCELRGNPAYYIRPAQRSLTARPRSSG